MTSSENQKGPGATLQGLDRKSYCSMRWLLTPRREHYNHRDDEREAEVRRHVVVRQVASADGRSKRVHRHVGGRIGRRIGVSEALLSRGPGVVLGRCLVTGGCGLGCVSVRGHFRLE